MNIDEGKIKKGVDILEKSNHVEQMMKVIGEEGTPVADFVTYLKSEFLDAVYLQQNTFDAVDGACSGKRQDYVFAKVVSVLDGDFDFENKSQARTFFQQLRQSFIDWNYAAQGEDEFARLESQIDKMIQTGGNQA